MTITSLSDLYFIAIGIHSYNTLFGILSETGIIYLPFIMVIYESLKESFSSDEGIAGVSSNLRTMEVKVYVMIIAFSLSVVPVHTFQLDGVSQYSKMCDVTGESRVETKRVDDILQLGSSPSGSEPVSAKNMIISLSGSEIRTPILLKLALKLGTGVGLEAVSRLPCSINLTGISQELLSKKINDPVLKAETKQFVKQCYNRANTYGLSHKDNGLPWIADPNTGDQPWPGHSSFMNNTYYGNKTLDMTTTIILDGYDDYYAQGKKPTCLEWWKGKGAGEDGFSVQSNENSLKQRLINSMDSNFTPKLDFFSAFSGNGSREDNMLKQYYFNPHNFSDILKAETKDYGNESEGFLGWVGDKISRLAGTIGMVADAVPSYAGASLIQLAAPIAKGVILLVIIALLPVAYIVSMYSFKFIVSIHFFIFSVLLWPYLWELAMLVQQSYIEEVVSSSPMPIWSVITQPNVMLVSKKLTDGLFLAFPAILTSLLSVAGMAGGQALNGMAGSPGSSVGSAGNRGGSMAQKKGRAAASKAITRK